MKEKLKESDLYPPIKKLLESQGYEVKGEIGKVDVVGIKDDEMIIIELKTAFSLSLFHQAVERKTITDNVYIAVFRGKTAAFRNALAENVRLSRLLGLGVITVRPEDSFTEVHADPGPYKPRINTRLKTILLREFLKRKGDPSPGGSDRRNLITAYRQDALRIVAILEVTGPQKASITAKVSGVKKAREIMSNNHYSWFMKFDTGIYGLSPEGKTAATVYKSEIENITN